VIDIKRITIPVFLIYAGIIHAIGLALLLPMIVTLPGPGSLIAPAANPAAGEIDPAEQDREATSALSAPPEPAQQGAAIESTPPPVQPDAKADAPDNIANLLPPATKAGPAEPVETKAPAPQPKASVKADAAKRASTSIKPARQTAKPYARRFAKKNTKIAPFGGGMSGLFTPGSTKRIFDGRN
jgi:hypothetical protein